MVSTVDSGQQIEQDISNIEKQQSDIQDLHSYLQFIASLPGNEDEFMEEFSLTGTAAEKLQEDIKNILTVYSIMRDQCGTFQSDTFIKIIDLATKVRKYAAKAMMAHPDLHENIKSLSSTDPGDDRNNTRKLKVIRFQVADEKKQLDEGIAIANECRQGIAGFQSQTAKHAANLGRKVKVQDNKQRGREEGDLIALVKFIQSQAEIFFMTCDSEKTWEPLVGLVPKPFHKEEKYKTAFEEIKKLAEKEELVDQRLWLYRGLIIHSLKMVMGRVEAASATIASFRGIFDIFKADIEMAADFLGKYEDPVFCNAHLYFNSDVAILKKLSDCASNFILNATKERSTQ